MAAPLIIRFATDVEPARKGMASLRADVVSNLNSMNLAFSAGSQGAAAYGTVLSSLAGAFDTVATGLAALDAAKAIIGQVSDALNDAEGRLARTLALAQGAQGVGVGASFFQVLTGQAKELGVETSTLIGYLTKAQAAATVKLGVGNDAKSESDLQKVLRGDVQIGNITQADANTINAATTGEVRLKAVLDLMDKLKNEGKILAQEDLARNFFGEDFVTKLRTGVDLVGAMRKSLDGAGVSGGQRIISDEEIACAEAMKAQVQEINNKFATGMKPVLEDIAYLQDQAKQSALDWSLSVANLVVRFGEAYQYVKKMIEEFHNAPDYVGQLATMAGAPKLREALGISDPLQLRVKPSDAGRTLYDKPIGPERPDTSKARPGAAKKGGSETEDPDAVEQLIRALGKARDVQEAEFKAVGATVVEREKLLALARGEAAARDDFEKGRRTSAALDEDEKRRILERAEALGKAKAATQDLEQQQRQGAETARYFGQALSDGISDAILDGKSLSSVFADITKQLAKAVLQAELLGTGPLAGLLGTAPNASAGPNAIGGGIGHLARMFGIGSSSGSIDGPDLSVGDLSDWFADGGYTGHGGTHEPAGVVHRGEYVIPKVAVARIGLPALEAMRHGVAGYAAGGLVGGGA